MTDQQIYEFLSGDDLGTTEPCHMCAGKGHRLTYASFRCPTCNGTGRVFRTDEKGRERIAEAVRGFCGDELQVTGFHNPSEAKWVFREMRFTSPHSDYALLHVWDNRHNQPWQAALESHVREYKSPCPDLTANDGAELKRLLRESHAIIEYAIHWHCGGRFQATLWISGVSGLDGVKKATGDSEASALIEAVKEVLPQRDENSP